MTTSNIFVMISIVLYLVIVVGIGMYLSNRNKTTDDFYLGGRKLGPFVTAMSAEASDMSSYLLMGLPGLAYFSGLCDVTWTIIGLALGTYLNWLLVAKRLRNYSHVCGNSTTVPIFFSNRYRDNKHILSAIAAVVIIIFFVPYTASGFSACGKLFASLFGANYHTAMILSAIIIALYTTLGGFLAASISDFIQSIVMTIALIIVVGFGVTKAGGFENVFSNARALPGYLSLNSVYDVTTNSAGSYGLWTKISTLAWGLGYFGMPHILLRFMAIENPQKLKLSRRIASVWVVISMGVAVLIGIVGYSMTKVGAIGDLSSSSAVAETLIIEISKVISTHGWFAAIIAGVILAGILAATMSTADSQLLAASSSVSQNLMKEILFKNISEKTMMIIARITVVVISLVAIVIAWNPESSVFSIVSFAWAGFGAAFGPTMLFALFWKRSNKWGALAGMLVGGIMVFVWKYAIAPMGGFWNVYELLPAFIAASIAIVVVSLLTPAPSKEIADEFESLKTMKGAN
jgi:sodium/proline symporter